MHSPALAQSLRAIAREGRRGFYEGAVAEDMVATLRALGGAHALEDFAGHRGQWVEPIAGAHAGLDLAEIPPNGHGVTALVILAILDRLGVKPDGPVTARRYHLLIEAARQAYRARDTFIADPEKADVPLAHLLSGALADELASRIDPDRRRADLGPVPPPPGSDTIYLSVVDRDGMAVSFINSVFWSFGSAIVSEKTGIALQNRGCGFVLSRGHRNVLAPAKRPLHTIIPAMATRNGEAEICFGVMGGAYQPVGHVTAFTNMVDFGLDPQAALDAPRCFFEGDSLVAEHGVPDDVAATLGAMGHAVVRPDEPLGGGQIIRIDRARGVLIGGSDPRKDGFVAGL